MRPLLAVVVFLATAVAAGAADLRLVPEIEAAADGDRVVLRWDGVPQAAVEQEVLVSLDGGSRWIEVRRLEITVRRLELRLPRGFAADLLFALRTGDRRRELEAAVTRPVRTPVRLGTIVPAIQPRAFSRPGEPRTDGSGGGGSLPPAVEASREGGLDGLRKTAVDAAWQQPPGAPSGRGPEFSTAPPAKGAAPLTIPLRT